MRSSLKSARSEAEWSARTSNIINDSDDSFPLFKCLGVFPRFLHSPSFAMMHKLQGSDVNSSNSLLGS